MRRSYLWLTEDEAAAFVADVGEVFEKYIGDRDAAHHPAGTRRVLTTLAIVPEVPETGELGSQ